MRLRKIRQQFKDSNPRCATNPDKYYRSHSSRTRKRWNLFRLFACYSDTNNRQLRRRQPCIHELRSSSSRIRSTLQRQISYECRGTCQLVSIRQIRPWSNYRSSVRSPAPLHRQAEEMGHGTVQPSTYTISTESRRQGTRRTCRNSRQETRQRIPSTCWQFPLSASTYFFRNILGNVGTKQIHYSIRSYTSGDSQETSTLPQRTQERQSTMVRSRLHRRTQNLVM